MKILRNSIIYVTFLGDKGRSSKVIISHTRYLISDIVSGTLRDGNGKQTVTVKLRDWSFLIPGTPVG